MPIEEEIAAGNGALIALTELAHDYHEGFLLSKNTPGTPALTAS